MQYFLDTEFIEDGKTIDLISIGLVADDGREYYAVSNQFNPSKASDWVLENVLAPMGIGKNGWIGTPDLLSPSQCEHWRAQRNRKEIAQDIVEFVSSDDSPKFWGEWCSYDWVALCQLFGTMMDLPQNFPMRCRDIIQRAEDELGIPSDQLPPSLETEGNHNALLGARTVHYRFLWLQRIKQRIRGGGSPHECLTPTTKKAQELLASGASYAAIAAELSVSEAEAYLTAHPYLAPRVPSGFPAVGSGGNGGRLHVIYGQPIIHS
jgi:hypothetical protein